MRAPKSPKWREEEPDAHQLIQIQAAEITRTLRIHSVGNDAVLQGSSQVETLKPEKS